MKIVWAGRESFFIDIQAHLGLRFATYGQTAIQEDLFAAADRRGATVLTGVEDVRLAGLETERPQVRFRHQGEEVLLSCDFVAGCDGFHGVSRPAIPRGALYASSRRSIRSAGSVCSRARRRCPTSPMPTTLAASRSARRATRR